MIQEIWKPIIGFSRYEASNLGNLRSLNYKNSNTIKNIKPSLTGGYYKTMLQNDEGKYKSKCIHYFITLAFFGIREKDIVVNHIDSNKLNNKIENLEYCSISHNIKHAYNNGLLKPKTGESNGNNKLSEKQIIEIRLYVKNSNTRYYGRKALAEKYNVSEGYIKDIISGRRNIWAHLK